MCLIALFLSTSVATYFYWLQEQWHETTVFTKIESGVFEYFEYQIKLTVKDKTALPEGYAWEEEGREFSHQGMYYDIISITKTSAGWEITAASDKEEAQMVANKQKLQTEGYANGKPINKTKYSISKVLYDNPTIRLISCHFIISIMKAQYYQVGVPAVYLGQNSPPPEFA